MPAKGKGASSKKSGGHSRQKTKPASSPKAESSTPAVAEATESKRDAENFTRGVIIRGEAAVPDEGGDLPPGATHEIVGEDEKGLPVIERRRYSAF
jgi:hypothetical protein